MIEQSQRPTKPLVFRIFNNAYSEKTIGEKMKAKELKRLLEKVEDDKMVIFQQIENGREADISYGIDQVAQSDSFVVLRSID